MTTNGGQTWTNADLPITQLYHVAADNRLPYYVYGAEQDLGTTAVASDSLGRGITRADTYPVGGGESGYAVPHPKDPNIVYAGSYAGIITRYDHRTKQVQPISPWPDHPMGWGAADLKYRFQWTAPIATSPHDPEAIHQTRAKSPKDTLNFPIRINDKMSYLVSEISGTDAAPTKQANEMAQMLKSQLDDQLSKLNVILATNLTALNDLVRKQNIPPIGGQLVGPNVP